VVSRSTCTDPDSSWVLLYHHTEVPYRKYTRYPVQSHYADTGPTSPALVLNGER